MILVKIEGREIRQFSSIKEAVAYANSQVPMQSVMSALANKNLKELQPYSYRQESTGVLLTPDFPLVYQLECASLLAQAKGMTMDYTVAGPQIRVEQGKNHESFMLWTPHKSLEQAILLASTLEINIDFKNKRAIHKTENGQTFHKTWPTEDVPDLQFAILRVAAEMGKSIMSKNT